MLTFLQISPVLLVLVSILFFKWSPIYAASIGVLSSVVLWLVGIAIPVSPTAVHAVMVDTSILFMSTALVVVPGLAFVILIEKAQVPRDISLWIKSLGWGPSAQVIFIVLGFAPLLESMTGFGVSLIATVPLLLSLFPKERALRISLAGMVIMPWGTLGLATLIGASLAHLPALQLGVSSSFTSAPVFLSMAAIALWLANVRSIKAWMSLLLITGIFLTVLLITNYSLGPEIAGVTAGLSIVISGLLFTALHLRNPIVFPSTAWPYMALLSIILIIKVILALSHFSTLWVITGNSVTWQPLTSPGIALMIVVLIMLIKNHHRFTLSDLMARTQRPVLTILFFLLMSQIMVKAGFLLSSQELLRHLPLTTLPMIAAILGGAAGYVTGSNVGGNALLMSTVGTLPIANVHWLAAVQNSAAGHGALGSLSILSMVFGLSMAGRQEEASLARFAFVVVLANIGLVGITGSIIMAMH